MVFDHTTQATVRGVFGDSSNGQQRLFEITAEEVGVEVPQYLSFVEAEIHKHGRYHPFVKTQYFCKDLAKNLAIYQF